MPRRPSARVSTAARWIATPFAIASCGASRIRHSRRSAGLERDTGHYRLYATRHEALDCDAAVWQGARNVSRVNLLPRLGHGDLVERDQGIHDPRPK